MSAPETVSGTPDPSSPRPRRSFSPLGIELAFAVLAASLVATFVTWRATDQVVSRRAENKFYVEVQQIAFRVDKQIARYLDTLVAFQGFYAASKSVERDKFRAYYRGLHITEQYPGFTAIDFVEYVPAADRAAFIERVRADTSIRDSGFPDFNIFPDDGRADAFVVTYIEPFELFERKVHGFDLGSDPIRRGIIEQARDTGTIVATPPLTLISDEGSAAGSFLLLQPVYRNGMPTDTLDERRAAFHGLIAGMFRATGLFADIIGPEGIHPQTLFQVFDGTLLSEETMLYGVYGTGRREPNPAAWHKGLEQIQTLDVGGRTWTMVFRAPSDFGLGTFERILPLAALVLGIAFGLLLFTVLYNLSTSRTQALKLAGHMTEELRSSESHFRSLIDHAQDIITILEPTGVIRYESPSVKRILGYEQHDLIRQNAFSYMHPEDVPGTLKTLSEGVLVPGSSRWAIFRFRHKDGSWRTLEAIGTNLLFNPAVRGIVINSRDVTDRMEAQRQIQETSERFRTLVSNLPGVVYRCACDSDWTMEYLSDAIEPICGYPAADFIGNRAHTFASIIHPDDRMMVERVVLDAVLKREPYVLDCRVVHRDGSVHWVYEKGQGVFGPDGKVLYLDGALFDVTDRKLDEQEIRAAYHTLKETQNQLVHVEKLASIGKLAAGVAHEVKNPLAIVIQGINFLEAVPAAQGPQEAEVLQMMKKAITRADIIIRDLLDFARPTPLTLKRGPIGPVLEASVELVKSQLKRQNVQVTRQIQPDLPPVMLDEHQMRQVFINLIMNAFQAMPNGGDLFLRASARQITARELSHARGTNGKWAPGQTALVCEIEDTGVGIPAASLSKVTDPFFTTKPAGQGTGLGLSITQSILGSHQGLLAIESVEGKGTKISILLPVAGEAGRG